MMVAGVEPRTLVEPQSVDELTDRVRELYARETPFAFIGGGTEMELGNLPRALDTLVRTTACTGVIDYAPEDQTITVEAGMTIAAVSDVLARERQFLAIDAPDPERATVGGAIATNLSGPRRLRYGGIKDTIVGVEIVRPDGVRARGGGKVVKNVAGFDIPKLMVGSLGTLGAIVGATFRVFPVAERRAALMYAVLTVDQMMSLCAELIGAALVPAAVTGFACAKRGRYDVVVTFEGFARGVEEQMTTAAAIAVRLGVDAEALPDDALAAQGKRERALRRGANWHLTVCAPPTALAHFVATTPFADDVRHAVDPLLGTGYFAAAEFDVATVAAWRTALGGGSAVVNALPAQARRGLDSWGEPPKAALAIMRRLKATFDPKGLCNAGRFVGGL